MESKKTTERNVAITLGRRITRVYIDKAEKEVKIKYELPQYRFSSFKKYKELAKQYRYVYKLENDLLYKYDTKHDEFHLLPNANIKKFNSFFKKLKSTSKLHIPKENIFCIKLHETLGNGLELGCITRPW